MKIFRKTLRILLVLISIYVLGLIVMYYQQEKIIFHPVVLKSNHLFHFDSPFEELFLRAKDGKKINIIYFKSAKPKAVMLLFHGNTGNLQICGNEAEKYLKMGYDVLMPDYRSFGKNNSELTEENLLSDALLSYDFLKQKGWKGKNIVLYGMSLGTGMATYVASKRSHSKLLLYAPYWSMKRLALEKYPFVPNMLLKFPIESYLFLKKVKTPVYIFHGTGDGTIPLKHAYEMYALTTQKGKLLVLKGGKHNDLASFKAYQDLLVQILK